MSAATTHEPQTAIDQVIIHNDRFAKTFSGAELSAPPSRRLLVIACMDARINLERALGLHYGEAHILRNAGGTVTQDVLRSAIVSTNVMGTREIMVINHTGCGMMACTGRELEHRLVEAYGPTPDAPDDFHTFNNLVDHVRDQVAILRDHRWIPSETTIRGFTYDVESGQLHEVDCT